MSDQVGFVTMAGAKAEGEAPEIGIGMLGYAFMGKAHSNAFKKLPNMMYPPIAIPKLVAIAGRNEAATAEAAKRYGYQKYYTDWRDLIADPKGDYGYPTAIQTRDGRIHVVFTSDGRTVVRQAVFEESTILGQH